MSEHDEAVAAMMKERALHTLLHPIFTRSPDDEYGCTCGRWHAIDELEGVAHYFAEHVEDSVLRALLEGQYVLLRDQLEQVGEAAPTKLDRYHVVGQTGELTGKGYSDVVPAYIVRLLPTETQETP